MPDHHQTNCTSAGPNLGVSRCREEKYVTSHLRRSERVGRRDRARQYDVARLTRRLRAPRRHRAKPQSAEGRCVLVRQARCKLRAGVEPTGG